MAREFEKAVEIIQSYIDAERDESEYGDGDWDGSYSFTGMPADVDGFEVAKEIVRIGDGRFTARYKLSERRIFIDEPVEDRADAR